MTVPLLTPNPMIEWDVARLRRKSKPVATIEEGEGILRMLVDVSETFYKEKSAGIAAPQIGIFKRVFIIHGKADPAAPRPPYQIADEWQGFINPVVHETEHEGLIDYDGCLSFPGMVATTKRWKRIKITAMNCPEPVWLGSGEDETREDGLVVIGAGASVVFQHEFDHLNGVLFFERVPDEEERKAHIATVREHQKELQLI